MASQRASKTVRIDWTYRARCEECGADLGDHEKLQDARRAGREHAAECPAELAKAS